MSSTLFSSLNDEICSGANTIANQLGAPCNDGDASNGMMDVIDENCMCVEGEVVSVDDIEFVVRVYPNPTSGLIHIQSDKTGLTYQFVDMMGNIVLTGLVEDDKIDIGQLSRGVYVLRLDYVDQVNMLQKIIKL